MNAPIFVYIFPNMSRNPVTNFWTKQASGLQDQTRIIDAAIAAGVKRFIPSEFGSDSKNEKSKVLPIFGPKVAVRKYLDEKIAANPDFTYTIVSSPHVTTDCWGNDANRSK